MAYSTTWDETTPAGSESRSLGDDRIRELKVQLRERLEQFLINDMDADPVVAKSTLISFVSGTKMVFFQVSAPTGWTQDVANNDKALRVVSGVGGGSGGTLVLSSATVSDHTLTIAQMPAHTHSSPQAGVGGATSYDAGIFPHNPGTTGSTGGGGAHNHGLALAYIDVIVCSKN